MQRQINPFKSIIKTILVKETTLRDINLVANQLQYKTHCSEGDLHAHSRACHPVFYPCCLLNFACLRIEITYSILLFQESLCARYKCMYNKFVTTVHKPLDDS